MILIHQISNSDLEYCNDIKECLNHNLTNPIIRKIVIFSSCINLEKKIGMDLKSKKLLLMKFDLSLFEIINYGKKNSKSFVIYGSPFIRFNVDLANMLKFDVKKVLKDDYSYYIFDRNLKIKNERDIDDILVGEKIKIFFKTEKLGYYRDNDFQSLSYSWRVSKNIQKPCIPKINPKIDIPKITPNIDIPKMETIDISEQIIERPIKNKYNTRKLDVVIVSVNYNDFLLISLENNSKIFENITVITSSNDFLCQKICEKFKVKCIVTDVMYEDGALFNKGKAINEGIRSIVDPDYILLLDADIVVMEKIDAYSLEDDVFYTSDRYMVNNFDSYQSYISGDLDKDSFLLDDEKGYGFFQLFNYVQDIKYPEFSNDASTDDIIFRDSFNLRKSIEKKILHLGLDSNWKGRCSKSFLDNGQFDNLLKKEFASIPKTFKICTFYYNPQKDVRREENFLRFLSQFEGYQDNMLIGLVDYDGDLKIPNYLKENILTIKGDRENHIWYKETLMNRILDIVDTDYIIWMDNDIIYESLEWLNDIDSIVRGKDFVQLYGTINYLGEDGEVLESYKSILSSDRNDIDTLLGEGYKPGGSWIGKTSILKKKRFFEKMYVGGGDTIFLYGLFGIKDGYTLDAVKKNNEHIWKSAVDWIDSLDSYRIGYLNESIDHLYHGDLKDRNYNGRYERLSNFEIDEINSFSDKKVVIYTCISGNYDSLKEVVRKEENIDYICFTDQDIKSESWEIRPIPKYLEFFDNTKRARCIKILPHIFLDEYDISIWVDGNIQVLRDTNIFLSKNMNEVFCIPKHPDRVCVYEEADAVKRMKKDSSIIVDTQVSKYRNLGYPEDFGMVQSNIIIRQHKDKDCIKIGEGWWNEVSKNSKRDQLAFNFSIWEKDFSIYMMDPSIISSDFFQIWTHVGKLVNLRKGYGSLKNYINGIEV